MVSQVLVILILFVQHSHYLSAPLALFARLILEKQNPLFLGFLTALKVHRHFQHFDFFLLLFEPFLPLPQCQYFFLQ